MTRWRSQGPRRLPDSPEQADEGLKHKTPEEQLLYDRDDDDGSTAMTARSAP